MELKVKRKEGPHFAADVEQLKRILAKPSKERIILGGQLFMCSLENLRAMDDFLEQPPRPTRRALLLSRAKSPKLRVAIDKEALGLVARARVRPIFAVDALLRYGQRIKSDEILLLSAVEATSSTLLTAMHFRKGEMVSFEEFVLAAPASHTYEADVHVLLERLRMQHMGATFHWCGPLGMPRSQTFITASAALWTAVAPQALTVSGKASVWRQHGLSMALSVAAAVGYGAALWVPYTDYTKAAKELAAESSRLQGDFSFASERLALLQARQTYMNAAKSNLKPLTSMEAAVHAISERTDVRIKEAHLSWPRGKVAPAGSVNQVAYDFEFLLEVPALSGTTALEQSVPLVRGLSARMGTSLRLATLDGMREVKSPKGKGDLRHYRIQGDFPNAS